MSTGLHTVHVRVNDASTGQPTPVRLRITDEAGNYYPPFGRLAEFATGPNQDVGGNVLLGMKAYAYIDGTCEVQLPSGKLEIQIDKGPEYAPLRHEVALGVGKISLRLAIAPMRTMHWQSWYSGDTRAHFLSPHAALLEAAAEDLTVVNLLAQQTEVPGLYGRTYPCASNIIAFSGQQVALERPGHIVVVNTHNIHPVLGSVALLNCHRPVYPLNFGGPTGFENWAVADWCDQCHRKAGLVIWTRLWHESSSFRFGEPLADLVLGKVDAVELDFFEDSPFDVLPDWYALLNCGLRVPLVGGSGKDSNGVALGSVRTCAKIQPGESFSYKAWIEAIRAGRTVVTNGPLLSFSVNGRDPGACIQLDGREQKHQVRAEATSNVPFEYLELLYNGEVVASANAAGSPTSARLELEVTCPKSGWLAARCHGQQLVFHRPANQRVFAHSSPIYVQHDGEPYPVDQAALSNFLADLDDALQWLQKNGRFENDRQREHLTGIFGAAKQELIKRATL